MQLSSKEAWNSQRFSLRHRCPPKPGAVGINLARKSVVRVKDYPSHFSGTSRLFVPLSLPVLFFFRRTCGPEGFLDWSTALSPHVSFTPPPYRITDLGRYLFPTINWADSGSPLSCADTTLSDDTQGSKSVNLSSRGILHGLHGQPYSRGISLFEANEASYLR